MNSVPLSCDVCFSSGMVPYPGMTGCGRELLTCTSCGLVMARPGSRPSEPRPSSPREPRDDERRAAVVRRLLESGRVLEVGCGTGGVLAALDPTLYVVTGIEPDPPDAAIARERLRSVGARGGVPGGDLVHGGLPAESFDLVALFGYLGRCESPRAVLMEVSRLLRPGGCVLIETPSLASLTAWLRGARWQPLHDPVVDYFFTPDTLRRLVTTCGFEPGAVRPSLAAGWPHPGVIVYLARKAGEAVRADEPASAVEVLTPISSPLGATH